MKNTINLDRVRAQITGKARLGVLLAASEMATLASERAPILDGFLRSSVIVTPVMASPVFSAVIAFNSVYAAYQHEGVHFKHPKGGEAKFLENVVTDAEQQQRALDTIRSNLKAVFS